jgi:hypothetical protein
LCDHGFTLSNGSCSCTALQSLVSGTCVSCNVPNCSLCNTADICFSCGNGYLLGASNDCNCPNGCTVSLIIDYLCVSCAVPNCLRCDHPDICASYNLSPVANSTSPVPASNEGNEIRTLWIVIIAVCVVCGLLLAALILLTFRMSSMNSAKQKVQDEPSSQELPA